MQTVQEKVRDDKQGFIGSPSLLFETFFPDFILRASTNGFQRVAAHPVLCAEHYFKHLLLKYFSYV
jgi:hypothetical protein